MDNLIVDHTEIWQRTKDLLRTQLPNHAYNTWFDPVSSLALNDQELILEVPNRFFYEWIESHYQQSIEQAVSQEFDLEIAVKYTVSPNAKDDRKGALLDSDAVVQPDTALSGDSPPLAPSRRSLPPLNKYYTFSTFIEGANNQFAKAAAMNVAEAPGQQSFNPLVVYGGVGLGKTHLLHAIGNHILHTRAEANIISATSEKFTLDFISSIQKNKTIEFSRFYRKADVLLIDDIQFFQRKEQTQEQFFHTFNELYQAGKQIVLTADKYPGEMERLQERLLSRFQSGLAVDIQPPDFETRVAILMEKAEKNGLELPYDIIEFLATHIKNNIRELESTIIRLLAHSSLSNVEIDMDLVKKVVRERIGHRALVDVTMEDVVKRVSALTHVSERDIVSSSRKKQLVEARQLSIYMAREILNASLSNIGLYFGGRDHTTVLHACRSIEQKLENGDRRLKNLASSVRQELSAAFL